MYFSHIVVDNLQPLGEEICWHPCLYIVSVCDTQTLHRIALECPGLATLANDEKRKRFASATASDQCGDASQINRLVAFFRWSFIAGTF